MATVTTLKLKFGTANGTKTWNYKYADSEVSASDVDKLMDTMITNGSVFAYPPLTKDSAELVQTITTTIEI